MGTDIHFYLEKRENGNWILPDTSMYEELWTTILERDYNVFASLADVRNYNKLPSMSVYRKIPKDITTECKEDLESWDYSDYCHWATLKEFYDFYISQPAKYIEHGVLVGSELRNFKEKGKNPTHWCQGYYGSEPSEVCEWEVERHPLDYFMTALLTLSYIVYQQIIPLENIRTSEVIKKFVEEHGEDIRGIFWFDS